MEIDDKLKNRLAGTVVVTVLAIIFLPMMFDDPKEKKAQDVSGLEIPNKPEVSPSLKTAIIPEKTTELTAQAKPGAVPSLNNNEAKNGNEKPEAELIKQPLDVANAGDKEEKVTSVKKETANKEVAASEQAENPVEESKPSSQKKKLSKPELPVLEKNLPDKKDASSESHRWMVQVVSLTDQTKANAFRDKLRAQGFPASVETARINGRRVFRLKVGPELDAERAQSIKAKINQLNHVNSIAIPE